MASYYNDIDPFAVAWLKALMASREIPDGEVDARSIVDVGPADLDGFRHCHFFAGIGGWAYALRLAEWPDDRPVWTGSCPCQPFSGIGQAGGFGDSRHLWPAWFRLIGERRPAVIFGEQVANAAGRAWLDHVCADLEARAYAIGAANLCAASVGAPHIRQRLYWVGLAGGARLEGHAGHGDHGDQPRWLDAAPPGPAAAAGPSGALGGVWEPAEWIPCRDGFHRPIEPGTFPMADGIPARVGRLRGYGNAVVPPLAAAFIRACEVMR